MNLNNLHTQVPRSRPPYKGVPRLQPNGTYLCDSDTHTLVSYLVRVDEEGLACTCPWWHYHYECKHCDAVAQGRADEKPRVTLESLWPE